MQFHNSFFFFLSDLHVAMWKAFVFRNTLIFVEILRIGYWNREKGWEILIERMILRGSFLE